MSYLLIRGNSLNLPLADRSVQMCATSPPYWSLRDYGLKPNWWPEVAYSPMPGLPPVAVPAMTCCLGLEPTPEAFVGHLVLVFREVRRVLRDDGVCFINLGDTYQANVSGGLEGSTLTKGGKQTPHSRAAGQKRSGLKPKDRVGIPHRVVFALQADGWFWRDDIVWFKRNPMPESVTDRCTKAHESVFMLAKSERYFFDQDAIREPHARLWDESNGRGLYGGKAGESRPNKHNDLPVLPHPAGANKRSVWDVTTKPESAAHFACWPPDLVRPMILAGTSEKGCCPACGTPWRRVVARDRRATRPGVNSKLNGIDAGAMVGRGDGANVTGYRDTRRHVTTYRTLGWEPGCGRDCGREDLPPVPCVVLDPFNGSGTTGEVARLLGRSYVGVDANPKYLSEIATRRVERGDRPHKGEAVAARPADLPGQLNFLAPEPTTR